MYATEHEKTTSGILKINVVTLRETLGEILRGGSSEQQGLRWFGFLGREFALAFFADCAPSLQCRVLLLTFRCRGLRRGYETATPQNGIGSHPSSESRTNF